MNKITEHIERHDVSPTGLFMPRYILSLHSQGYRGRFFFAFCFQYQRLRNN